MWTLSGGNGRIFRQHLGFVRLFSHYREIPPERRRDQIVEPSQDARKPIPTIGACKLCLREDIELLESHFVPVSSTTPARGSSSSSISLTRESIRRNSRLTCCAAKCEERFSVNGEDEVLKHVAPKNVLKAMPLAERMRVAWARDNDPTAPRHDARDYGIDTDKFAYFALSIVWRRTIHEWSPAIPRWELGQFAEDMRKYLVGETPFPVNMSVLVMVCSDEASRRIWTIRTQFVEAGCLNFAFDVRGIRFRVMMGHLPTFAHQANCRGPLRPIFLADCEKKTREGWENTKAVHIQWKLRSVWFLRKTFA